MTPDWSYVYMLITKHGFKIGEEIKVPDDDYVDSYKCGSDGMITVVLKGLSGE